MREIKFRAWFKAKQEMISWKQLSLEFKDGFTTIWIPKNKSIEDAYDLDDIELMQYTGFTRNEKEIYEDDICESLDGRFLIVWNDEKAAFEIMFQDGERLYLEEMWEDTKVIGNIHDNLDLWEVV